MRQNGIAILARFVLRVFSLGAGGQLRRRKAAEAREAAAKLSLAFPGEPFYNT